MVFLINTGAFLGATVTKYEWNYTDPDYGLDNPKALKGPDVTIKMKIEK